MTELEAQLWLDERGWWHGPKGDKLRQFVSLVLEEADRQNLISTASRDHIWARHIVDSAQLMDLAVRNEATNDRFWIDLGAGAGFPGLVIACLREAPIQLIEMRPLRVAFLKRCAKELCLGHVEVISNKVERTQNPSPAQIISARAYAPFERLLATAHHLADEKTVWLLPKGRSGEKELENIQSDWQAVFHVKHSITDPESVIVTIRDLQKIRKAQSSAPARRKSYAKIPR